MLDSVYFFGEKPDLAASKLVAFRQKDRDFVRLLLTERMIKTEILTERIRLLAIDEPLFERLVQWVQRTAEEL